MAPGISSPHINLQAQIVENCEFFSGLDAHISLITTKEPLGAFKAIVLRTERGTREVLLSSEAAPSFYDALQGLHAKTAEAVQNFISSNGFGFVPTVKKRRSKNAANRDDSRDSDTASSTLTLDDCESLSDDETISVTSVGRAKKRNHRKADKPAKPGPTKHRARQGRPRSRSPLLSTTRARSVSPSDFSSSSESELHYDPPIFPPRRSPFLNGLSQRMPLRPPHTGLSVFQMGSQPPPPLPPGPAGGLPVPAAAAQPPPPPPPAPAAFTFNKPLAATGSSNTSPALLHDVILQIRWRPHGERRTLERMPHITLRAIREAATAFVRRQPTAFVNNANDAVGRGFALRAASRPVRAVVQSVVVDGVSYDLTGYGGDDLTRLVSSLAAGGGGQAVPQFEVDLWSVPPAQVRVETGPRPGSSSPAPGSGAGHHAVVGGIGSGNESGAVCPPAPPLPPPGMFQTHGQLGQPQH